MAQFFLFLLISVFFVTCGNSNEGTTSKVANKENTDTSENENFTV